MTEEFIYISDSSRGRTANNLVMAFTREAKASARYTLYSKQAQKTGYFSVGALFAACAFSEQIHAVRHGKAALFMGIPIEVKIEPVCDEQVPDMLGKMLAYETMAGLIYPDLIQEAMDESYQLAVLSFKFAMQAERVHITLCREAIDSDDYWKFEKRKFFVCSLCGNTRIVNQGLCECCGGAVERFITFNGKNAPQ